jgi:hypothetical protein
MGVPVMVEVVFTAVGEEMDEELDLFLSFFMKCSAPPNPFRRNVPPTAFIFVVCREKNLEKVKEKCRSELKKIK